MQPSHFETYTLQPIGATDPSTIAKAGKIPLRVLVDNVGAVLSFLAYSPGDLGPTPSTATFRMLPGRTQVFVLGAGQTLYAVGSGVGGSLSVATSEALPIEKAAV